MSTQQRLILAAVLCVAVIFGYQLVFPPPPPIEGEGTDTVGVGTGDEVADEGDSATGGAVEAPDEGAEGGDGVPAPAEPGEEAASPPTEGVELQRLRIANDLLALDVGNGPSGLVEGVEPLSSQFAEKDGRGLDFLRLGEVDGGTFQLGFTADETDFEFGRAVSEVVESDDQSVTLRRTTDEVEVRQTISVLEGYEARIEVEVRNLGTAPQRHVLELVQRMGVPQDSNRYDQYRAMCKTVEDLEDFDIDDTEEGPQRVDDVSWFGVDSNYFLGVAVAEKGLARCEVDGTEDLRTFVVKGVARSETLEPGATATYVFGLYLGAKETDRLAVFSAVPTDLSDAVDWGWLGAVSSSIGGFLLDLLRVFHDWTGIWGVTIILLTICVKIVTLPLTLKQYRSMRRMREIQPEMEAIRKKYANEKEKQSREMQALFQRTGVNPIAGCLPMIVQLPVWFALYSMLQTAVELYHQEFLWLPDLTKTDELHILPLGMGALMWLQMQIQPQAGDSQQAKMMKWMMPIFFVVMMWVLPSGLGVYIFANIVLSLIQSVIQLRPDKKLGKTATTATAPGDGGGD